MELLSREAWVESALDRYEQPLLRYAFRLIHRRELARDVVQDVFLQLCQADPARIDDRLAAWLFTVCRNRAFSLREKEARMVPLDEIGSDPPSSADIGAAAVRNEAQERVMGVISRLPEQQQEAVHLKFREGMNYREISGIMGVSLGTVSNLIANALDAIRNDMRPYMDPEQEAQSC